jgi:hypothetical protein
MWDRVEQRAYEIWEEEGRPEGRAKDHWSRAEAELSGKLAPEQTAGTLPVTGPIGGEAARLAASALGVPEETPKPKAEPRPARARKPKQTR